MGKVRVVELSPPLAGVNKRAAFQNQEPYTTPSALNVRPNDVGSRRNRIGTRPGTGKAYQELLGSGNPIRLLSSVSIIGAGEGVWTDNFSSGTESTQSALDSTIWSEAAFLSDDGPPVQYKVGALSYAIGNGSQSAVRTAYAVDTTNPYYIEASVTGYPTDGSPHYYRIYARMDNSAPNAVTNGIIAELILTYATSTTMTYSGTLKANNVTVATFSTGTISNQTTTFLVKIDADNVTCTVGGSSLCGATAVGSHTGQTRVGFGFGDTAGQGGSVYYFRIRGEESSTTRRTITVASSNGQLYKEDNQVMTAVGASDALNATYPLMAAERTQKLYIANYSITDAAIVPKVYDPTAGTVSTWTATTGTVPTRCKLVCRYRDRMVLAGSITSPHLWYMSRLGNPLDWDYGQLSAGDTGSAISSANADAGAIGEEITCLAPFSDDYLVFGCTDSLWVMRGDPAYGGQLDNISRNVGIVSGFAHCTTPSGDLVFLSKDGVYMLSSSAGGAVSYPQSISRELIPDELLNVDTTNVHVQMAYDVEFRGVHIILTSTKSGQATHYWLDWENKSFWPVQYPYTKEPMALHFVATPFVRGVLVGCRDGYIRRHDNVYTTDDGTAISSHCVWGPVRTGGSNYSDGMVLELAIALDSNLNDAAYIVQTGETAQQVVLSPTSARTGTLDSGTASGHGLNKTIRPRARGGAAAIKITQGADNLPWAVEQMTLTLESWGKQRL